MEKTKGRIIGYYQVTYKGVKMVAEWRSQGWWCICGSSSSFNDKDFEFIGELIIFK